jgi:hypothetical protein
MLQWVVRIALVFFHAFQYVVSASSGSVISQGLAAVLAGTHILPPEFVKERFRVRPLMVSLVGSFIWFMVLVLEFAIRAE